MGSLASSHAVASMSCRREQQGVELEHGRPVTSMMLPIEMARLVSTEQET